MTKIVTFLIFLIPSISFANIQQEAETFAHQLLKQNDNPNQQKLSFIPTSSENQKALQNVQNIFEQNLDQGTQSDPIKDALQYQKPDKTNQETVNTTESLLKQKHNLSISDKVIQSMAHETETDMSILLKPEKEKPFIAYEDGEFGNALTQFSAIKEMNAPMQDGLGGINGSSNPSAFHGHCRRCTVMLGKSFKDCCHLKGIAQGLLGDCREEEKQLANAAVKDKRCHKVADKYCTKKILGVCVEKKEAYCCYGSQMAKVIQEIAHYQLSIPWGDGNNPRCDSLTAVQLSKVNFDAPYAQAQLAPLISEYQTTAQKKATQIESNVKNLNVDEKVKVLRINE